MAIHPLLHSNFDFVGLWA